MLLSRILLAATAVVLALGSGVEFAGAESLDLDAYRAELNAWRADRAEGLQSDTGWLTVAGFFWLEAGDNPVGSAPGNRVLLPSGSSPGRVGVLRVEGSADDRRVIFIAEPGVTASIAGEPVTERVLTPDQPGPPDRVEVGRISFWILLRGGELAVRVRDPQSSLRDEFTGLNWFDIDPEYRLSASFVSFDEPYPLVVPNILGYVDTVMVHGGVDFELGGRSHRLIPANSEPEDDDLFFVIGDETSGSDTYGGGRFLRAERQEDGTVILDFNRAYNPPCAYNPWTTCPQPSRENILPVAIHAGEKAYAPSDP